MPDLPDPAIAKERAHEELAGVACLAMNRLDVLGEHEIANRLADAIERSQEARGMLDEEPEDA